MAHWTPRAARLACISALACVPSCAIPTQKLTPPSRPSSSQQGATAAKPAEYPGLHNVVAYGPAAGAGKVLLSGSAPETDEAFAALEKLSIKTIISVDGAVPEVELASAHGMRYVHLPIGYDGFDDARKAELVRAARDLPKPIYIHCHHGKHRSAGAAATIAISLGWLTNAEAEARMKVSGTAAGYKGLWACAENASAMPAAAIDAARADFPQVSPPASMVKAMVAIDKSLDHLRIVEKNAWAVPADRADLVPVADAGKIADLMRILDKDAHIESVDAAKRADFRALLARGSTAATSLEDALSRRDAAAIAPAMKELEASCKSCHLRYRD